MKKVMRFMLCLTLGVTMAFSGVAVLGGCSDKNKNDDFTIVCFNGGRGTAFMTNLIDEFKKTYSGNVVLKTGNKDQVQTDLTKMVNSGEAPDLVFCDQNIFPSSFITNNGLEDLSGLLDEKVMGEEVLLKDKFVENILESFSTKPYGDGKVYTLPLFYSPTGLFYNQDLFYANNGNGTFDGIVNGKYELPRTWDEFFALGDLLKTSANGTTANPYLFTVPTVGYTDSIFAPTIAEFAGMEKFNKLVNFEAGIYDDADVKAGIEKVGMLLERNKGYIDPSTQANVENAQVGFIRNQQNVIDGKVLFMPNGDWVVGEMSQSTPAGFKWGFMPIPAKDKDTKAYMNTFIERMYIPKDGTKKAEAKDFIKLIYSDNGAKIVAKANGAIVPTTAALQGATASPEEWGVTADTLNFYKEINNASTLIVQFAATKTVPDHSWNDTVKDVYPANLIKGTKTTDDWIAELKAENDIFRAAIIK